MDPFMISTVVVRLTAASLTTAKLLHDIRSKYKDAPMTITTICCETTVITASLSHVQAIICQKQDFVQLLDSRPELAHAIDASLTGCMIIFSCLDEELRKITEDYSRTNMLSKKGKAKTVWNLERLRDLLDAIRGQQTALNLLLQLVQLDSLGKIKQLLTRNQTTMARSIITTQSLKKAHKNLRFPASIYSVGDRRSIYSNVLSVSGASATEFDFDDMIVNSKVYRRQLAKFNEKSNSQTLDNLSADIDDAEKSPPRASRSMLYLAPIWRVKVFSVVMGRMSDLLTGIVLIVFSVFKRFGNVFYRQDFALPDRSQVKLATKIPVINDELATDGTQPKDPSIGVAESAKSSAGPLPVYDSLATPGPIRRGNIPSDSVDKQNLIANKLVSRLPKPIRTDKESSNTHTNAITLTENHAKEEIALSYQARPELSKSMLVSACVLEYCFAEGKYWYGVEAEFVDGRTWRLLRHYEDFYDFHILLLAQFPEEAGSTGQKRKLPYLTGPVDYVTDRIAEGRQRNLNEYVKLLLKMPPHILSCTLVMLLFAPRAGSDLCIE